MIRGPGRSPRTAAAALLAAVCLLGGAVRAAAARPVVAYVDVRDRYTITPALGTWLAATDRVAAVDVTDAVRRGRLGLRRARALVVGSFATSDPAVRDGLRRAKGVIDRFLRGGGTVIVLAQADEDEAAVPWLPRGLVAERGERDADAVALAAPDHPLLARPHPLKAGALSGWALGPARVEQASGVLTVTDAFARLEGFRTVAAVPGRLPDGGDAFPAVAVAAVGKGRVVLVQLSPDRATALAPAGAPREAAARLLANLLDYGLAPHRAPASGGHRARAGQAGKARAERVTDATPVTPFRPPPPAPVRVQVFRDEDGDGQPGPGEPPLAGVAVTHAFRTVETDAAGAAEITVDPGEPGWIAVTVPDGLAATTPWWVDAWALPAPPAPVRFGLRPRPEGARPPGRPLVIAQLTDTHLGAKPLAVGRAHLDEALAIVAAHDPPVDVVLATGDLTASGAPAELSAWRAAVASLGGTPPVLAAMGNHDLTRGPDPGMAYQRACGPWAYEQELAGYRFVVVYQRALDHPSIVWARQRIAASPLPVVLVLHHWPRRALADALVGPNVVAVLSGDWHDAEVRRRPGGAVDVHSAPTLFGGWDHSPAAVRFVQVAPVAGAPAGTPPVVATELRYLRQPEHLAIVLPEAAAAGPAARQVLVQAYDSRAEVRRVTYELAADGAPVQARGSLRRCGTWAWCGTLAAPLPAGAYRLDVRAEAADGRAWTARRRLHVDAAAEPAPVAVAAADGAVPGAAPARVDGAWPTFRGDTARSGHAGPALAPPLRVAWAAAAGGEVYAGGPVAADGVVVLPLMDRATTGARRGGVAAFDLADGQPRWRYRGGSSVRHSPTIVPPAPGGPAARGADGARGLVVFQQTDGATVALDLATGVERWRHDLAAEAPPPFAGYYALAGPLVISERSGAERSGAERSGAERSGPERSGPERGGPERGGPERGGPAGRVYVGPPAAPRVLDLATGTVLAKLPALDGHPAVTHASPLRLGRLVLWPTRNRGLFAFADRPRGGRLREAWRAAGLTLSATPVAAGDEVVALAHDGLYVVDGGRGRVRARFPVPAGASAASPLVADDDVYVPAADGALLALDRRTGAPRWRFETGPALLDFLLYRAEAKGHSSSPLLAGTVLYFGGHDGHVYALDRRDGAVAWSFPVGLPVPSAPALVGDTLLIADHGGVLYAFRPAPGPASAVGGGGPGAGAATP